MDTARWRRSDSCRARDVGAGDGLGRSAETFIQSFGQLAAVELDLSERERIGIDLVNASFFEPAADTRLIMLVVAIEALAERQPRSADAQRLVEELVAQRREVSPGRN